MTPRNSSRTSARPRLRIGAVSQITGIPVDTLRAWERRYEVVSPRRAGGTARLYDQDDVDRLQRIKRLVDAGHAIGSVARLGSDDLDALLELHAPEALATGGGTARDVETVLVYSASAASPVAARLAEAGLAVLHHHRSWDAFAADAGTGRSDALVIDLATLSPARVTDIADLARRVPQARTIVIYAFGNQALVDRLDAGRVLVLRSPITSAELLRDLARPQADLAALDVDTLPEPAPAFSDGALAELANVSTSVQCECPHHLVDLVRTLANFEAYSAECENRDAKDAAVHARLRRTAAAARSLFERALFEVIEYEGLALPDGVRVEAFATTAEDEPAD